jgi:hypothetical protein
MKPLSKARLRQVASGLHLAFDDEELTRLLPMVRDLLDVAEKLRRDQPVGTDPSGPREPVTHQSG